MYPARTFSQVPRLADDSAGSVLPAGAEVVSEVGALEHADRKSPLPRMRAAITRARGIFMA